MLVRLQADSGIAHDAHVRDTNLLNSVVHSLMSCVVAVVLYCVQLWLHKKSVLMRDVPT
jgi:hypothetical protein